MQTRGSDGQEIPAELTGGRDSLLAHGVFAPALMGGPQTSHDIGRDLSPHGRHAVD